MVQLTSMELATVMEEAKVRQIMADEERQSVTVDYFPAREAWVFARAVEGDPPAKRYGEKPITITFTLDTPMFGGVVYAAVCVGERVVLSPFVWQGYEHFGTMRVTTVKAG